MDTKDFDALMELCDQLNFQNRDNRHIVPFIRTRLQDLFMAYTNALSEHEEKVSVGEALLELMMTTVMMEAERAGLDPERTANRVLDVFEGMLNEIGNTLEDMV